MLTTLRSIASLPRHLVDGMQAAVETTHQLPSLQRVVTARAAVASDLERVRATVEPQHQRVAAIEAAIVVLPHLPDPPTPGPFARARETLVGRS
jgi:hypothetical protein